MNDLRKEILDIVDVYGWSGALQTINFGDELLEEYCVNFEHFDWQKVGCYQTFSEEFFIQHKNDINLTDVLFNARNLEWAEMDGEGEWVNISPDIKTLIALDSRLEYLYNFAKENVGVIQVYRDMNAEQDGQ
jgi:hypothetical protein